MKAALASVAAAAAMVAVAASSWACVTFGLLRLDRQLVAGGGELELTISAVGGDAPPPLAIRLDRLDAPPLVTVTPGKTTPTVVRVRIPEGTARGQHILIANEVVFPRPPQARAVYEPTRALFTVVEAQLATANPAVESTVEFRSPVPFEQVWAQLWDMGADLVGLRYRGATTGEFVNQGGANLVSARARLEAQVGVGAEMQGVTVDRVTVRGQVEAASFGPLAPQVERLQVVGLPEAPDDGRLLRLGVPGALVLAVGAVVAVLRRRRGGAR